MSLDPRVTGNGAVWTRWPDTNGHWLTCVALGQLARPRKGLCHDRPDPAPDLDAINDRAAKMNPAPASRIADFLRHLGEAHVGPGDPDDRRKGHTDIDLVAVEKCLQH